MKILFYDIETTGFSRKYDYIIELAAILYDEETDEELAVFHEYIKPGKKIPLEITSITGITNEMVANARSEKEVIEDFIKFINKHEPAKYVGHNIDSFDFPWLRDKSEFYFLTFPDLDTIDTLKIARKKEAPTKRFTKTGRPSYTQEALAEAYAIEYEAHSAIEDVKALLKIYKILISDETEEEQNLLKKQQIKITRKKLGF